MDTARMSARKPAGVRLMPRFQDRGGRQKLHSCFRNVAHGFVQRVTVGATTGQGGDRDDEHPVFILLHENRQVIARSLVPVASW